MIKQQLQKALYTSLSVMVLAACSPNGNLPGQSAQLPHLAPANTATNNPDNTATMLNSTNSPAVEVSSQAGAALQNDLTALHEEEAIYQDSLTAASEGGFSTQMLDIESETELETDLESAEVENPERLRPIRKVLQKRQDMKAEEQLNANQQRQPLTRHKLQAQQAQQAKIRAQQTLRAHNAQLKAQTRQLLASDAVQFNDDGTVTLDTQLFKRMTQNAMQNKKQDFRRRIEQLKPRLEAAKELTADKYQQLKRKNFVVRTSDKEITENEDGSTTETIKVEFKNERTGIQRTSYLSRTHLDGKLLKTEFELQATTSAYERNVTRVAEHNEDGSKTVLIESITTWKNGKVREMSQERLVQADGSASGHGTITVTYPDGQIKNKEFNVSLSARGDMTSHGRDGDGNHAVLEEDAEGNATMMVEEEGAEPAASELTLSAEAEADANDEDENNALN